MWISIRTVIAIYLSAAIAKTIPVPASEVDGHHGHHSISFDSGRRMARFTNPGERTISGISRQDPDVRAKAVVGGTLDAIVAIGAPEHKH